ncbi:MAG TPA: adenine deaminase [Thermoanaerobaculia bacterium]|jgi:adenine deaminase|nr:adenine deaminase [Thermoanaerobaculia bacterium]
MDLPRLLAVARGAEPADLLLADARLVDVLSGEVYLTGIAIAGGQVAGLGDRYEARRTLDLAGRYVCPGLIDAHVHIESSLVPPAEFARAVVPHGVTTVVTDPHEIGNVLGLAGIRFMLADAVGAPLAVYVNAPSCVPATDLETAGACLDAADLASLLGEPGLLGLAEVMSFPAVVAGREEVLAKLRVFSGTVIDGHCPGLSGKALQAYAAAGISSDHECTTPEEAREKLRAGLTLFIREATNARNLAALLPVVTPANESRICFCTDDRQPDDLLTEGSIDHMIRQAIARGLDPVTAIRLGTLHAAQHYRLHDRGAVAPGRRADLIVFSDLGCPRAELVFRGGELVARDGRMVAERTPRTRTGDIGGGGGGGGGGGFGNTVRFDPARLDFAIRARGRQVRAIGVVPDQLLTESLVIEARIADGLALADPGRDLLKIAVVERHQASGRTGLGFVHGVGLQRGAIAGTVAHDHHNLVVIGADDRSMRTAALALAEVGGGLAATDGDRVLALLPLPIAGLMSDRAIEEVQAGMRELLAAARDLGARLRDPFMAMSFLGLEVIPALKITDLGLIDVGRMAVVPLFVDGG